MIALFFMLGRDRYGFDKKRAGARCTKLVFLHSSASEARNVDTLFFMLWWPQCGLYKERARTRYAELGFL
jgi:hypothetical protein